MKGDEYLILYMCSSQNFPCQPSRLPLRPAKFHSNDSPDFRRSPRLPRPTKNLARINVNSFRRLLLTTFKILVKRANAEVRAKVTPCASKCRAPKKAQQMRQKYTDGHFSRSCANPGDHENVAIYAPLFRIWEIFPVMDNGAIIALMLPRVIFSQQL